MIIRLEGATAGSVGAARRSLAGLVRSWDQDITSAPASAPAARTGTGDGTAIDPVSLATLAVPLPSALAVLDLADRIRKRRRAKNAPATPATRPPSRSAST